MKKLILLIVTVLINSVSFSQSTYENKCAEIFIKYWKILSLNKPMSSSDEYAFKNTVRSYWMAKKLITVPSLNYVVATGKDYQPILDEMDKEFLAAQSLMTESEKFQYMIEEESQKPYGAAKWNTVDQFLIWMKKGAYEKTVDYQQRLKDHSISVYDSLLLINVQQQLANEEWYFEFGQYNADKELLPIIFYEKEKKCSITHRVHLTPDLAKNIGSHQPTFEKPTISNGVYGRSNNRNNNIALLFNFDDILFDSEDSVFIPKKFYVNTYVADFEFDNGIFIGDGAVEVVFKYDDCPWEKFNAQNEYMKGHIFNYTSVYSDFMKKKKQRAQDFNNQIAAAIGRYDDILKNNSDNIFGYTMDSAYFYYTERLRSHSVSYYHNNISYSRFINVNDVSFEYDLDTDYNNKLKEVKEAYETILFEINKKQKALSEEFNDLKKDLLRYDYQLLTTNLNNSAMKGLLNDYAGIDTGQDDRNKILSLVRKARGKSYYPEIVNFVMEKNQSLSKEWAKNGSKFKDKIEFYEAFTGNNYKAILKSKQ